LKGGKSIGKSEQTEDPKTNEREIEGLLEAMQTYNLSEGTLILRDTSETSLTNKDGRNIHTISAWKWLLTPYVN
jgi:hypothetical protein